MPSRLDFSAGMALVVAFSLVGNAGASERLVHDLRSRTLDPAVFRVIGADEKASVNPDPSGGGLRITIAGGAVFGGSVGVELVSIPRGDFDLSVGYRIEAIGPPRAGFGAGLGLSAEVKGLGDPALTVERQVSVTGDDRFVSTRIASDNWGVRQYDAQTAPAAGPIGRLRLVRQGSTLESWVSEGGGPYRRLRQGEVGEGDVRFVRMTAFTGQADCRVDVVLSDFQLETDALDRGGQAAPFAFQGRLFAFMLINIALGLSLIVYRLVAGFNSVRE